MNQPVATNEDQHILSELSDREREILQLLGQGLNNSEISKKLFLTEGTVKNYISSILAKIGAKDRTQAAVFALRVGFGR